MRHRSSNPATRKKYVALVEAVQTKGGDVVIFSSMHESGQREFFSHFSVTVFGVKVLMCTLELNQLTGIAAILTFPLDVEVVEQEEKEAEEERQREAAETAGSA